MGGIEEQVQPVEVGSRFHPRVVHEDPVFLVERLLDHRRSIGRRWLSQTECRMAGVDATIDDRPGQMTGIDREQTACRIRLNRKCRSEHGWAGLTVEGY